MRRLRNLTTILCVGLLGASGAALARDADAGVPGDAAAADVKARS